MAEDDDWRRRRARELESEREEEEAGKKRTQTLNHGAPIGSAGVPIEKISELLERADILIDQLSNAYQMYVNGIEKLPPIERRKTLDQIMATLTVTAKPTQALLFKCNGIASRYAAHKERWDRMVKTLETGKLNRRG